MAGRHASATTASGLPVGRMLAGVGLTAVLVAGGFGVRALLTNGTEPSVAATSTAKTSSCSTLAALKVSAAPEIERVVTDAAARVTAANPCQSFRVTADPPRDIVTRTAEERPQIWIPDSSTWVNALATADRGAWKSSTSVATSPILLAIPKPKSDQLGIPTSWRTVIGGNGSLVMADPDFDAASRLAYLASRVGATDKLDLATGGRLILLSRFTQPSADSLLTAYAAAPAKAVPFPVSEQSLASFVSAHSNAPFVGQAPRQGTLSLDYPVLSGSQLNGADRAAVDALTRQLTSPVSRTALTKAGFREDGGKAPTIGGREPVEYTELAIPNTSHQTVAAQQWRVLRTDMRMLAVLDVSGSMNWDSRTSGLTRWDVLQGACVSALKIVPAGSQIGAWVFSSAMQGKVDYKALAPIQALNTKVGSTDQRAALTTLVKDTKPKPNGDTGLYDTTLAAFRSMNDSWRDGYVNSVVVMTDGINDDTTGGISLAQLLTTLKAEFHTDKPVRIITIGMGEADPGALKQISAATGGTSYIANTPQDIERVFVEALLARPLPAA